MAYVQIPKDLSKVKVKAIGNFTKRQLICFAIGAAAAVPCFFMLRPFLGNTLAIGAMFPILLAAMFFGVYEKDGMLPEVLLKNYLRTNFVMPQGRIYMTENNFMEKGGGTLDAQSETETEGSSQKQLLSKSAGTHSRC